MTSTKGLMRKIEALKPGLEKLAKKGVKIRIAAPLTKESASVVKDLMKIAEVKHTDKINARFCVIDNKELMFMVLDDEEVHPTYDVGIWVNTPLFANALNDMFELAWKGMQDGNKVLDKFK